MPANWAQINSDVLEGIVKQINLYEDFVAFSCVSTWWRSIAAATKENFECKFQSNQMPWLMLLPEEGSTDHLCSFYSLSRAPSLLEINDSVVVKWLLDGSHKDSEGGVVLDEIADLMLTGNGVAVSNIPRSANRPAYVLAGEAMKTSEDAFWMEECPHYLDDLLKADVPI
ncbi:hypothetical protein EZV62_022876 [Acer yangbiense]|uniref:Uncharacterized protein n=1 Tax=Acer yangbiense TaxID=1000413 RepID=A0A5C7H1I6_9ROSI|nr:hypothetical protein EZV62_022876 [Acer yangbiense]